MSWQITAENYCRAIASCCVILNKLSLKYSSIALTSLRLLVLALLQVATALRRFLQASSMLQASRHESGIRSRDDVEIEVKICIHQAAAISGVVALWRRLTMIFSFLLSHIVIAVISLVKKRQSASRKEVGLYLSTWISGIPDWFDYALDDWCTDEWLGYGRYWLKSWAQSNERNKLLGITKNESNDVMAENSRKLL